MDSLDDRFCLCGYEFFEVCIIFGVFSVGFTAFFPKI